MPKDLIYICKYNKILFTELRRGSINIGFEVHLNKNFKVIYWYDGEFRTSSLLKRLCSIITI